MLHLLGGTEASKTNSAFNLASAANSQASNRLGIVQGETPGGFRGVFSSGTRMVKEDVYETKTLTRREDIHADQARTEARDVYGTRDVYSTRDVFETRDVYGTREVYGTRDVYSTRDVFETQDVYATRDLYGTRDVYETQGVFEERAVYHSNVTVNGTRDLRSFSNSGGAGIDTGAQFSVAVGSGEKAIIEFTSASRIAMSYKGQVKVVDFNMFDGSFRSALTSMLNTIDGMSASFSADGKLQLNAGNSQAIKLEGITRVVPGLLGLGTYTIGSPLGALGLTAGTTTAGLKGYEQVQVGTKQVKVGTEQYVTGTEQYLSGTRQVKIGQEQYVSGTEQYVAGNEQYVTGTQQVKTGSEQYVSGTEQYVSGQETVIVGYDRVKIGDREVTIGHQTVKVGTKTRTEESERILVGLQKSPEFGVGYLEILDKLANGGSLPAGYVDKLFGTLGLPDDEAEGTVRIASPAADAYAEAKVYGAREEERPNRWAALNTREGR